MKFKNTTGEKQKIREEKNGEYVWTTIDINEVVDMNEEYAKNVGFSEVKALEGKAGTKKVETKVEANACEKCGKSFDTKRGLAVHKSRVH